MKILTVMKHSALLALVLGFMVGCATAPQQEEPEGPTVAEAQAAIDAAHAAVEEAEAAGAAWRDSADMVKEAEAALAEGDTISAVELANRARRQAENALAQKRLEERRLAQQRAEQEQQQAPGSYTVERGDSLWSISGKSDVYNNPYKWPLIYKANRDKISDADLIYPGQNFTIRNDWSDGEVDAAVEHARTRGAWSLGVVEESDRAYLAR
ncbi:LysM peptidoglycan-binding domain-containing protein [Thiohalomonas denitrificans]|uniref:LysM domain-containing protein n=1 Tax=Thiohalomonas denitrificans TaxID=415747 RepID=A0A1G5QM97_9GAMM|nr:LysM peptidoglycan-binding domain-containing protein [Thiohalomonas denitrificans]SCZ62857.1 LysM domain-containing protein [Thiohalomonas denitrificans]